MRTAPVLAVTLALGFALIITAGAAGARSRREGNLPVFPVETSCRAAQQFSSGTSKDKDYESCMRDEARAKSELAQRWSSFKPNDKKQCVEEGPDPSYVEMLTCLEMDTSKMIGDTRVPQIGGAVAPGLGQNQ